MSTICTVLPSLGNNSPIVFTSMLGVDENNTLTIVDLLSPSVDVKPEPSSYKHIELISKDYVLGLDLMFAYDDTRKGGLAYLGMWNDGVVEG